jgi:hypothetical protein
LAALKFIKERVPAQRCIILGHERLRGGIFPFNDVVNFYERLLNLYTIINIFLERQGVRASLGVANSLLLPFALLENKIAEPLSLGAI